MQSQYTTSSGKVEIPGQGWSSPIVWDNLIVLTSAVSEAPGLGPQLGLYDGHSSSEIPNSVHRWMGYGIGLDDGQIRWEREVRSSVPPIARHGKNTSTRRKRQSPTESVFTPIWLLPSLNQAQFIVGMIVAGKDYPSNLDEVAPQPGRDGVEFEIAVDQVPLQLAAMGVPPKVGQDRRALLRHGTSDHRLFW